MKRSIQSIVPIVSQGASALTNLTAALLVAQTAAVDGLGTFAVAQGAYVVATGVGRGAFAESFLRDLLARQRSPIPMARKLLAFGAAAGALFMLGGLPFQKVIEATPAEILIFSLCLPLLCLLEGLRTLAFAQLRGGYAVAADFAWLGLIVVGSLVLSVDPLQVWLVSGALISLPLLYLLDRDSRVGSDAVPATLEIQPNFRLAGEYLSISATALIIPAIVTGSLGIASTGVLRASQLVFAPFQLVTAALSAALVPVIVRARGGSVGASTRAFALVFLLAASLSGYSLGWYWVGPDALEFVIGVGADQAHQLLPVVALGTGVGLSEAGLVVYFRSLGSDSESLALRVLSGGAQVVAFAMLSGRGLLAALWGSVLARCGVVLIVALRRARVARQARSHWRFL